MENNKKVKLGGNGTPAYSAEDVRALLEPFIKEDLQKILEEAALRYEDVLEEVRKVADKDPANRKLFVRGLGTDMSIETFRNCFSQYGEIEDALVVTDKVTGKCKGYGFVTYLHTDSAILALKEPAKKINGRTTVCQLASEGPSAPQDLTSRKIYVGGVPLDADPEKLQELFAQYGELEQGPIGFDKNSKKSRGYALFVYKTAEAAKRALEEPVKSIDGFHLYCKYALEKPKTGEFALQGQPGIANVASLSAASSVYQNALAGAAAANSGLNVGFNPGLSTPYISSVAQQLLGRSFIPSSLNSSLGSSNLQHLAQLQNSVSDASLGAHGLSAYGSALGGPSPYASSSLYGVQTSLLPGSGSHLSLASTKYQGGLGS